MRAADSTIKSRKKESSGRPSSQGCVANAVCTLRNASTGSVDGSSEGPDVGDRTTDCARVGGFANRAGVGGFADCAPVGDCAGCAGCDDCAGCDAIGGVACETSRGAACEASNGSARGARAAATARDVTPAAVAGGADAQSAAGGNAVGSKAADGGAADGGAMDGGAAVGGAADGRSALDRDAADASTEDDVAGGNVTREGDAVEGDAAEGSAAEQDGGGSVVGMLADGRSRLVGAAVCLSPVATIFDLPLGLKSPRMPQQASHGALGSSASFESREREQRGTRKACARNSAV